MCCFLFKNVHRYSSDPVYSFYRINKLISTPIVDNIDIVLTYNGRMVGYLTATHFRTICGIVYILVAIIMYNNI